jgi:outer membrane lipoprotein LolB
MLKWLLPLLLLSACATAPVGQTERRATAPSQAFSLNGRVAIKQNEQRFSSGVVWTHEMQKDEILLLAPLGQTVARIERTAQGVRLDAADKHTTAPDAESLTQQTLGWRLPLTGLQYWVQGVPLPDVEAVVERDELGRITQLLQNGWTIHYTRYASDTATSLPLRLTLERAELTFQLLIDSWNTP